MAGDTNLWECCNLDTRADARSFPSESIKTVLRITPYATTLDGGGGISSTQERGFEWRHCVDDAEEQFGEGTRQASLRMEAFHVLQRRARGPESIVHHPPLVGGERGDQVTLSAIHGVQCLPQRRRIAQRGVGADFRDTASCYEERGRATSHCACAKAESERRS